MKRILITMMMFVVSALSFASYESDLSKRMDRAASDFEYAMESYDASVRAEAMDKYHNIWDAELNKVYKLLMAKLSSSEKTKLRNEQRAWLKRRERKVNEETEGGYGMAVREMYYAIMTNWTMEKTIELAKRYDRLK